jgi:hypothetical protein
MHLKKWYLQNRRQWTASGTAAAILLLALLGLGIIGSDMPHTAHSTYEPEPTLDVSVFASGSSTATMTKYSLNLLDG